MSTEMTYSQLGGSGLTVSTIGLGCNNFGARMADEDVPAVVERRDRCGNHPVRHRRRLRQLRRLGEPAGPGSGHRRAEVIIATKFGSDMQGVNGPDSGRPGLTALYPDGG